MEVRVNLPFNELLTIVRQLSAVQKAKLKKELLADEIKPPQKSRLTELLLNGPVF